MAVASAWVQLEPGAGTSWQMELPVLCDGRPAASRQLSHGSISLWDTLGSG